MLEAQGSALTNKYAEGYPGRRDHGDCQYVDVAKRLAIERASKCPNGFRQRAALRASRRTAALYGLMNPATHSRPHPAPAATDAWPAAERPPSGSTRFPDNGRRHDHRIDMDEVANLARSAQPEA